MISAKTANKIWIFSQMKQSRLFHENCFKLEKAQQQKLRQYLKINAATRFGQQHKFSGIQGYKKYTEALPIQEWKDIQPWVDDIAAGKEDVLTAGKTDLFEETSGTSTFSKLIPYNQLLKTEIQKGVSAWMVGLYNSNSAAFSGSSYWSISPALKENSKTSGGIPIGIEDDKEYFNPVSRFLLSKIMATTSELKQEKNPAIFYFKTFEQLLMKADLSFISVWSPTFFLQLDKYLRQEIGKLMESIATKYGKGNRRVQFLKNTVASAFTWTDVWPRLSVLSCWKDAHSALWIDTVQSVAGSVYIQGKGLLSTEGICSVPVFKDRSPVLTVNSHFYEFRDVNTDMVYLATDVKKGAIYEAIITTGGGLYRYATGDLVKIDDFYGQAPCFRFIGRKNAQSDIVGEKLSEYQVADALNSTLDELLPLIKIVFAYPVLRGKSTIQYVVFIELRIGHELAISKTLEAKAKQVDNILRQNPYYNNAIQLRQIIPAEFALLDEGFDRKLIAFLLSSGKVKDGNMKVPCLFKKDSLTGILSI